MEDQKERLTLGVDAETKRRLKAAASAKGVSVSVYCRAAIDKELALEEGEAGAGQRPPGSAAARFEEIREKYRGSPAEPALEMLRKYHKKHPTRPGSTMTAVDYIREGREIREREMDGWLKPKNPS